MGSIIKFLLPLIMAYLLYKVVRKILGFDQQQLASTKMGDNKHLREDKDIVDICPQCGELSKGRHTCGRQG